MRKVMFQALVIASLLGMSVASATAIPQVDTTNTRGGKSGSGGVEQQAAMAPASSTGGAYRAPNNRPDSPGNFISIDFGSQGGGK